MRKHLTPWNIFLALLVALTLGSILMSNSCSPHGYRSDWNKKHSPTAPDTTTVPDDDND